MTNKIEPGRFSLNNMKLKNQDGTEVDIGSITYSFSINESITNGFIYGSAQVFDSTGILYDLPLKGEEILTIDYTDCLNVKRTDVFFVYSISNVKTSKQESSEGKMLEYTLKFVSLGKMYSDKIKIRKAYYNDTIKSYVQSVFDTHFKLSEKTLSPISNTAGMQNIVVPDYTPEETMHMFARRAYSEDTYDSDYRFYETRDGYHFRTTNDIIQKMGTFETPTYEYVGAPDKTATGQEATLTSILDISFGEIVDTLRDRKEGAYLKQIVEVDFSHRTITPTDYEYLNRYQSYKYPGGEPQEPTHNAKFVDEQFRDNDKINVRRYVPQDYQLGNSGEGVRPYPYYKENLTDTTAALYHERANVLTVTVYGRNNIQAGMIVKLKLQKFQAIEAGKGPEVDDQRSGRYLILGVENRFIEDMYTQVLTLSKSGLSV